MTDAGSAQAYRGSLDRLIAQVQEVKGIDLAQYRRAYLERRLAARMRTLGVHSYRQYLEVLDADPLEYTKLLDMLTINVTDFFRDAPVWDEIRKEVFPSIIDLKNQGRNRTIRMWSAGCATGEEPYSLAMMALDHLGKDASKFLVSVIATDLDRKALDFAEEGVYPRDRGKHIPPGHQVRFTEAVDKESFRVGPEVRKMVRFSQASLFEEAPMRVIDLILCRNVFIYFDREQQARVLENFYRSLARGGYLVLGRSEKLSPDVAGLFEYVNGKERIFRKPARL